MCPRYSFGYFKQCVDWFVLTVSLSITVAFTEDKQIPFLTKQDADILELNINRKKNRVEQFNKLCSSAPVSGSDVEIRDTINTIPVNDQRALLFTS